MSIRSRAMPSASRIEAIVADAATKTSTCRYFHFENACRLRWKSTRRAAATSGRFAVRPFICNAIADERDRHRIVRVDDVRLDVLDDFGQLPAGMDVELAARRQPHEAQALSGAPAQFAALVRHQDRALADLRQTGHRQQHLVLSATPRASRVDVERGDHGRGGCSIAHSFANFRKT